MSVKTATCSRVALLSSMPTPKVSFRQVGVGACRSLVCVGGGSCSGCGRLGSRLIGVVIRHKKTSNVQESGNANEENAYLSYRLRF